MSAAPDLYSDLLREVVIPKVFGPEERTRAAGPATSVQAEEIAHNRRIDGRVPLLASMSGKGGWSEDEAKSAAYAQFTNVSLLDHLMSVARGALQFAELDLAPKRLSQEALEQRLALVAAIAFLHDADKMLQVMRIESVTEDQMAGLMSRYGITAFLAARDAAISAGQMLALVDEVELTRAGRIRPGEPLPAREAIHDCTYVRLADRLDGKFLKHLSDRPGEKIGVDGVLQELAAYDALDTDALRRGWRALEIRDPHTPFLLDSLQAALSEACQERHGMPPLIETHHDGHLVIIVREDGSDEMIDTALAQTTRSLGAAIRIGTTNRGKIDLLDAPGTLPDLRSSIEDMSPRDREIVLRAGVDFLREHRNDADALLRPTGFLPRTPDLESYPGRLVPLWTGTVSYDEALRAVHINAVLVNAVLSCDDASPKLGIPGADQREAELVSLLSDHRLLAAVPDWLGSAAADTRRALLAALAAGAAAQNFDFEEALLGTDGLVAVWLEGRSGRPGLSSKIDASGVRLASAVQAHYKALLSRRLVEADESLDGRCHFTNAPAPRQTRIDGKTGLYGVNVSAFSGRDGRPESARSAYSETLVAPIAEAEHRLRQLEFERTGYSSSGRKTPVRITSPTTAGLFGALAYQTGNCPDEYGFADLLRTKIEPDKLNFRDETGLERRVRIARYEELPTRLVSSGTEPGQISFVEMAFKASRRVGRPIHVFRGLPHPRPEFVAFDTLPPAIALLLGGTGFRLEQIPTCLILLHGVRTIAEETGFGAELAMRIADPVTRFSACCDALERAETRLAQGSTRAELTWVKRFTSHLLGDPKIMKNDTDRALVSFGEAMALVQRSPNRNDGGNVAEIGLRIALETVEILERMDQTNDDSLVAGVAGEIEDTLIRRNLAARREIRGGRSLNEATADAARQFVSQVWHGAFKGAVPSSRNRRVALATYRFAFEAAAREKRAELGNLPETDQAAA